MIAKKWGSEHILHAGENYWMKRLVFDPHAVGSMHKHEIKDETWYVESGAALVIVRMPTTSRETSETLIPTREDREITLLKGDILHLEAGVYHQVHAGKDGFVIIEASSPHTNSDVYRIAPAVAGYSEEEAACTNDTPHKKEFDKPLTQYLARDKRESAEYDKSHAKASKKVTK